MFALIAASLLQASPLTVAALPPGETAGRGARVPFVEVEAENAATDGAIIGPDRTFGSLPAEASGRRAVRLERAGQFVEIVLDRPADGITLRYALPDSADGKGLDAHLDLSVDGAPAGRAALTSRFSWLYGDYPFTNHPADGKGHHLYDHVRLRLTQPAPAGARLRFTVPEGFAAGWVVLDVVDLEIVPDPAPAPDDALSLLDFGADPTGQASAESALNAAVRAGREQQRPVYIPPGRYHLDGRINVDRVTVVGAGPWHTTIAGKTPGFLGTSARGSGRAVTIRGLSIEGQVADRVDPEPFNAIGGGLGEGSVIEDLFIQHLKVGVWLDGPFSGLTIRRLRILDVTADGINLASGAGDALVEDVFVRGSGDDGLALWSRRQADRDIVFRRNTVIAPSLANGIAVYGGRDITLQNNLVADILTQGGGYHLGARFNARPFQGQITLAGNIAVRASGGDPNWSHGVGAVWTYALDQAIEARIRVTGLRLIDSGPVAMHVRGPHAVTDLTLSGVDITGGDLALRLQGPGQAVFANIRARGLTPGGIDACDEAFEVMLGRGDAAWSRPRTCTHPVEPPPPEA
ncbi:hypothetical protein ASG17_14235 [Brevundimonas sp. Leaf363]|uniref:glycosyl hydrolase family 28-related protein n=1 Tax=Brevundimonas sp. Leaf363 TaxID=1736353 RepID=UPI0006F32626|nr:glycosyl hydrolase family 28-related protein [Brevundimonas sp. Leaf363]KQS53677.1 hypothetical protein ASG17_14235 [Brevundimonas sp. Leaf363]